MYQVKLVEDGITEVEVFADKAEIYGLMAEYVVSYWRTTELPEVLIGIDSASDEEIEFTVADEFNHTQIEWLIDYLENRSADKLTYKQIVEHLQSLED